MTACPSDLHAVSAGYQERRMDMWDQAILIANALGADVSRDKLFSGTGSGKITSKEEWEKVKERFKSGKR